MSLRVTDYSALTTYLDEVTNEVRDNKIADMVAANMLFSATDEARRTHIEQILHGVAGIESVPDGSDFPRLTSDEGDQFTLTQSQFGAIVPITQLMRDWDLFNEMTELATSVMDEAMDSLDQSFADVLLNGFSTAAYTDVWGDSVTPSGPDSDGLFSATHSNGVSTTTFSNLINDGTNNNPALSRAAIVNERARGLKFVDPNGLTRPVRLDTVIVGPDN